MDDGAFEFGNQIWKSDSDGLNFNDQIKQIKWNNNATNGNNILNEQKVSSGIFRIKN